MKTRTFIGEEGNQVADELAKMAERVAGMTMDAMTRGRFDQELDGAARAYTAPEFAQPPKRKDERDRIIILEDQTRKLAAKVVALIGDELQHPIDITPLHELADRLHRLSISTELCRGRPANDGRFLGLVFLLGEAWRLGARRSAGTSSDKEGSGRDGPFVDFVGTALEFLEPNDIGRRRAGLGDRIRRALRCIRKTLPPEGG